ncbi:sphingomyelin phosphodiesterase [Streptomyces sp. NPDC047108]|uniref:sphingomyelin phosphodiesterase n=1 Tax=Streptomyces sp. NPDC047108 TaxID=3155025 RepID=UPI0033C9B2BA
MSVLAGSSMVAASASAAQEKDRSPAASKPAAATGDSADAAGTSAAVPRLDVLSLNAMLLPSFITDGWAQDERGGLIGSAPHVQGHDVVVFQELMDNSSSGILMDKLQGYPYRTPVVGRSKSGWDDTQGDYSMFAPEDGGVAIVSRWPITKRIQYIYDEACGTDSLSQKGFAYARLNVGGSPVHVLGTHLQADDSMCSDGEAAEIRTSQLKELRSFVDGLNIPRHEPVLFAGDMNVNRYGSEYGGMLGTLDAEAPAYDGHPYTMDPVKNGVARERYAGEPQAWLDYILYDRRHARPDGWRNTGLTPASPPWELDGDTYQDYSDHYPIQGS